MRYLIKKDFDFSPKPQIVQVFRAGQIINLTTKCAAHGKKLKAITKEPKNGTADNI